MCTLENVMLWLEKLWKDQSTKTVSTVWYDRPIRYVELLRNREKNRTQRTVRTEEDETSFSLGRSVESLFFSWPSVRPIGTTWGDCQRFIANVVLKANSGTIGLGRFHDWTWGYRDCCILYGLGSQRVEWEKCKFRLRHSGVSWAVRELPLCSSTEWVCLQLCLSPSPSISVCLRRSSRWLVQRASASCPMFYIEGLETIVVCAF